MTETKVFHLGRLQFLGCCTIFVVLLFCRGVVRVCFCCTACTQNQWVLVAKPSLCTALCPHYTCIGRAALPNSHFLTNIQFLHRKSCFALGSSVNFQPAGKRRLIHRPIFWSPQFTQFPHSSAQGVCKEGLGMFFCWCQCRRCNKTTS